MKKLILIIALMSSIFAQAQENYIIYTLYDSDTCLSLHYPDRIYWDLDQDGTEDIYFYLVWHSAGGYMTFMKPVADWKWSNSIRIDQTNYQPLTDTTTIDETLYWESGNSFINDLYDLPEWCHFAFRHQAEDGIHYGWAYISCPGYLQFCISGMGYCTLPDQSIQWGQTTLLGIEETEGPYSFATLHPNPTNSMVIITDENLRQAEVVNMLGQQVLSVEGRGNELQIDMAALPAGVYFVTITDDDGRKCVRKVIKK